MLKRRNTIHPNQVLNIKPMHPLDTCHSISHSAATNPFLSSSLEDFSNHAPKHNCRGPLSANSIDSNTTDPFLFESTTYNPSISQESTPTHQHKQYENQYPSHDQHDIYPIQQQYQQQQQQQSLVADNQGTFKDRHKRRMSMDVFKTPFNFKSHRRATCTASDIKRILTNKTTSVLVRRQKKDGDYVDYSEICDDDDHDVNNNSNNVVIDDAREILKTSRYYPDEQVDDQQQHYYGYLQNGNSIQDKDKNHSYNQHGYKQHNENDITGRTESYNPFLQHLQGGSIGRGYDMGQIHPFDSASDGQGSPYSPSHPIIHSNIEDNNKNPMRRRHSVFSNWSNEDCSRLLALQQHQHQQQQQNQQQQQQHEEYQEPMIQFDTKSSHAGDISQLQRHTATSVPITSLPSPHHQKPSTPEITSINSSAIKTRERPRRNTVILGKNLIHTGSSSRLNHRAGPNPETSSLRSASSRQSNEQDSYAKFLQRRQQQENAFDHGNMQHQQERRHPAGRPESSHSYKYDFLKDTARWKPHPWTAASSTYSSSCSSPSSPLRRSRFPHELAGDDDDDDSEENGNSNETDEDENSSVGGDSDGEENNLSQIREVGDHREKGIHRQDHRRHSHQSQHQWQNADDSSHHHRRYSRVQEQEKEFWEGKQKRTVDSTDKHDLYSPTSSAPLIRRSKPESIYHNTKAVQMRPYGHEDDDEDENDYYHNTKDKEYHSSNRINQSSQENVSNSHNQEPTQTTNSRQGCIPDGYDVTSQWQYDYLHQQPYEESMACYESSSSSAASFSGYSTPTSKTWSHDNLAKKASLAKAKFYKYLNNKSVQVSKQRQYSAVGSSSSDMEATGQQQREQYRQQQSYYDEEGESDIDDYDENDNDGAQHFGSRRSFTSSLRARVRLTRTKTAFRQMKRRLSEALSEATTKATSTLKNDLPHRGKKTNSSSEAGGMMTTTTTPFVTTTREAYSVLDEQEVVYVR